MRHVHCCCYLGSLPHQTTRRLYEAQLNKERAREDFDRGLQSMMTVHSLAKGQAHSEHKVDRLRRLKELQQFEEEVEFERQMEEVCK